MALCVLQCKKGVTWCVLTHANVVMNFACQRTKQNICSCLIFNINSFLFGLLKVALVNLEVSPLFVLNSTICVSIVAILAIVAIQRRHWGMLLKWSRRWLTKWWCIDIGQKGDKHMIRETMTFAMIEPIFELRVLCQGQPGIRELLKFDMHNKYWLSCLDDRFHSKFCLWRPQP